MRLMLLLFILIIAPLFSCNGQEHPYILLEQEKIELRYSTKKDVEKLLGDPEKIQYFEHGGEDFFWKNFTVCFYDEDRLSFHYDQNDAIIRITAYALYSKKIIYLGKDLKSLNKRDVLEQIKTLEERDVIISKNIISYYKKQSENVGICCSFWFNNNDTIRIIDMYYIGPW